MAKKLGLTIQETHRNTTRLSEIGIITKNSEGFFTLTEFGKIIVNQIPYFQTIKKFSKFFEEHKIDSIPIKFIQRIGALKNCKLVTKTTHVQENIKKIEANAEKKILLALAQAWGEEGKTILGQMKRGIIINTLVDDVTEFPEEIADSSMAKDIGKFYSKNNGSEQRKFEGTLGFSMVVGDKKAGFMFPNLKGEVDFNSILVGEDKRFLEWCEDIFDYFWKKSTKNAFPKFMTNR